MSHCWLKLSEKAGVKQKWKVFFLIIAQLVWDLFSANVEGAKQWCMERAQAKGGSGDGAY